MFIYNTILSHTLTHSALPVNAYGGFGRSQAVGMMSPLSSGYSTACKSILIAGQLLTLLLYSVTKKHSFGFFTLFGEVVH